jgi:hypothetical protein
LATKESHFGGPFGSEWVKIETMSRAERMSSFALSSPKAAELLSAKFGQIRPLRTASTNVRFGHFPDSGKGSASCRFIARGHKYLFGASDCLFAADIFLISPINSLFS